MCVRVPCRPSRHLNFTGSSRVEFGRQTMNTILKAAFAANVAVCTLAFEPAHAADVASGKGFLDSSWNYVQYLFADGAASTAMSQANKAFAVNRNVLGLAAARELQIQAETQIQRRDFLEAEKTLRRAVSLAPELVSTQALLALAIHGQGRKAQARAMLEMLAENATRALTNTNMQAEAMTAIAGAFTATGDPKSALQIYNQLIFENVDSAAVHAGRGEALQCLDDNLGALASFQLAGQVEPRFPNLELKRAQSLENLGRSREAESAYRVALQLDPASAAARASLARLQDSRTAAAGEPAAASAMAPAAAAASAAVAAVVASRAITEANTSAATKADAPNTAVKRAVSERLAALNVVAEKMTTAAPVSTPGLKPKLTAATTPTLLHAAKKLTSGEAQAAVLALLNKWQAAWASKDVESYLGFYAIGFAPVQMGRAGWEADRRVKLAKPGPIQLNIVEPSFEMERGVVKVNFTQEYSSSNFRDKTRKRLDWVQEGGEWRIQREATL